MKYSILNPGTERDIVQIMRITMTAQEMRKALKDRGFQVKLSRRNGVGAASRVTVVGHGIVVVEGGETDRDAFECAIIQVEIETGMKF